MPTDRPSRQRPQFPFPTIRVFGRAFSLGTTIPNPLGIVNPRGVGVADTTRSSGEAGAGALAAGGAFVRPGLAPAIEEIIVTAPRPNAPPLPKATSFARWGSGLGGFIAITTGTLIAKIVEEVSQQTLEEDFAEMMAEDAFRPGDTPVIVQQPEVIDEITVKARRPFPDFVLPPEPIFIDFDTDPFIMIPITPRVLPQRAEPKIDVDIANPTIPQTIPAPAPTTVPRPTISPIRSPLRLPLTRTITEPLPGLRPQTQPRTRTSPQTRPLTSVQPRVRPSTRSRTRTRPSTRTRSQTRPQLQPMTQLQRNLCPPCPSQKKQKEKKKRRTECFKKLVKESFDPDLDTEYKWIEIDCLTGREL